MKSYSDGTIDLRALFHRVSFIRNTGMDETRGRSNLETVDVVCKLQTKLDARCIRVGIRRKRRRDSGSQGRCVRIQPSYINM